MKIGLDLGIYGQLATPQYVLGLAELAEDAGFDSVWLADHVVFPTTVESRYPYSPSGTFPVENTASLLEPVATMGVLVGATKRVRIGTAVLVMPYRNPVLLAKMLTTLDVFSEGRIVLGAGVGWMKEEFEALATAPFKHRGQVTDEYIEIFKRACAGGEVSYDGQHYQLAPAAFYPASVQRPHIPVVIGGTSNAALRRVARCGDGWLSVAVPTERMPERLQTLVQFCNDYDRSPSSLTLYHKLFINIGEERPSVYGGREPGTGSVEQIVADISGLEQLGYTHIIIRYLGRDPLKQTAQLRQFVDQIVPRINAA
jgi:probable F420-dependent oxidoreductase